MPGGNRAWSDSELRFCFRSAYVGVPSARGTPCAGRESGELAVSLIGCFWRRRDAGKESPQVTDYTPGRDARERDRRLRPKTGFLQYPGVPNRPIKAEQ